MRIPVIIEVALNGATTKARNPNVPCDPNELIADAVACIDAGATIIHTHIEDVKIAGETAANRYAEAYREIRVARPDALLYPTVVLNDDQATKFAHVAHLAEEGLIDMIAFDPGSTNIALGLDSDGLPMAEVLYENSFSDIRYAFDLFGRLGVGPSLAIYEPSFLRATLAWRVAGRLPRGTFVKFISAASTISHRSARHSWNWIQSHRISLGSLSRDVHWRGLTLGRRCSRRVRRRKRYGCIRIGTRRPSTRWLRRLRRRWCAEQC